MKVIDRAGQVYGSLTALWQSSSDSQGRARWVCRCDCGELVLARGDNLSSGNTASCRKRSCGSRWVADRVGYNGAHERVRRHKGLVQEHSCADCGRTAQHWSYDHSDPNDALCETRGFRYSLDPNRYEPRCARCHVAFDRYKEVVRG